MRQITSIVLGKRIVYHQERGDVLPPETVTAQMVRAYNDEFRTAMDALVPFVVEEMDLGESWNEALARSIVLEWKSPEIFRIDSIVLAKVVVGKPQQFVECPSIGWDYLTDQFKEAIDAVLFQAQAYLEGAGIEQLALL
jgi:hypothetical protein